MTNEEAINELKEASDSEVRYGDIKHHHDEVMKRVVAFDMAIKALEAQPCEDCISRQAVDEYITNLLSGYLYDEERTRLEDLTAYIWELPSVTPKAESKNVFDKIRAEIEEERKGYPPSADEYKTINKVLQILDKYKSESEE